MNTERNVIHIKTAKQFDKTRRENIRHKYYRTVAETLWSVEKSDEIENPYEIITLFARRYRIYAFKKKRIMLVRYKKNNYVLLVLDNIEANDIRCRLLEVTPTKTITLISKYARYTLNHCNVERVCEELIKGVIFD